MTKSNANPGFGVLFQIGDGASPEQFDTMAEITDVSGIGISQRTDETTHMTSPDGWAEFLGLGIKEFKAFTLPMNFVADDPDQVLLMQTRATETGSFNYRIKFTDDSETTVTFPAIVNDFTADHPRDNKASAVVSFLPTGKPVWSTTSS